MIKNQTKMIKTLEIEH